MRVVFFSAARQVWGAEVSLLTLAAALAEQGVETVLVCPTGELADRAAAAGIASVHRVEPRSASFTEGRPAEAARLWSQLMRTARRGDRVVIFSYYLLLYAPAARVLLRLRGVRLVLDLHDRLTSPKARLAVRGCARAVDTVIACSRYTAEQLTGHRDVHHLHRPVAPAGPREAKATGEVPGTEAPGAVGMPPAPSGDGRVRIGIIGRISREKRHDLVIDAVRRAAGQHELVVRGAGDGFSDDHVAGVLAHGRAALGERFVAEGRVPPTRVMDELDVVVVGNPEEPMGRTVLEAQSHGVVAIVPDTGGASELVEHGVTGLVYAADDPDDLAGALERIAADHALAGRLASEAARRVPRPEAYATAYLGLLH